MLTTSLENTSQAVTDVDAVTGMMKKLDEQGFVPPKKTSIVTYKEGDSVQISERYQAKYLAVYGKDVIDDLIVSKVLESGELAVRHGQRTPFIVSKSHLTRRAE